MINTIEKQFYTTQDLADLFECNIMTIYRYIKHRKINAYKIGKEFRIAKGDLDCFLKEVSTK